MLLLAVAILFNISGQLLLKRAALTGAADAALVRMVLSPWLLAGAASLGVSMLLWVRVLRQMPLSVAHPISGVVYVVVPLASHFLWGEALPATRLIGIAVIIAGIALVAQSGT